jgi:hypothetical protein
MMDELVRPEMSEVPHLAALLEECLDSWDAVRNACGPELAGDPYRDMATAVVLAGYRRVTLGRWSDVLAASREGVGG